MKNLSNHRIRTGLATAAIAGGSILGVGVVGGVVNAQTDDTTDTTTTDTITTDTTTTTETVEDTPRTERREARREARQQAHEEIAALIGVEVDDLRDWVHGGGTLAEVAEQNGVDPQDVVDLIVEQTNERIDTAVENGRIDAEMADEKRAEIEERVTTRVNEGRPERGEGG